MLVIYYCSSSFIRLATHSCNTFHSPQSPRQNQPRCKPGCPPYRGKLLVKETFHPYSSTSYNEAARTQDLALRGSRRKWREGHDIPVRIASDALGDSEFVYFAAVVPERDTLGIFEGLHLPIIISDLDNLLHL
jgi:hypothetical protein